MQAEASGGLTRNRYFAGQLLGTAEFETEQRYHVEKQRLLNRCLHGCGVACGLGVRIEGSEIRVAPGLALDCCGREIYVPQGTSTALQEVAGTRFLTVAHAERPVQPVPAPGNGESTAEFSRVEETYELGWASEDPLAGHRPRGARGFEACERAHPISLARVRFVRGRFQLRRSCILAFWARDRRRP